jgi:hypothetical protein
MVPTLYVIGHQKRRKGEGQVGCEDGEPTEGGPILRSLGPIGGSRERVHNQIWMDTGAGVPDEDPPPLVELYNSHNSL